MRTLPALLALAALATVLAPAAAADTAVAEGPLAASTANTEAGDCEASGFRSRTAEARVSPDGVNSAWVYVASYCSAWLPDGSASGLYVFAGRCTYATCAGAFAGWWAVESGAWRDCSSAVGAFGPVLFPGCPTPDGSGPPLLPVLP